MSKKERREKEQISRLFQELTIELCGNSFTITLVDESYRQLPTQRIAMMGWEANILASFIIKHYIPSQDSGGVSSSRLSRTIPEPLPHRGMYPPGKPPSIGD